MMFLSPPYRLGLGLSFLYVVPLFIKQLFLLIINVQNFKFESNDFFYSDLFFCPRFSA